MRRLLTMTRTICAETALLAAALVMVIATGLSVVGYAPAAHAHQSDPTHIAVTAGPDHPAAAAHAHAGMHDDMARCCDDEPGAPSGLDCAVICAAMAGCHLQMLPGEAQHTLIGQNAALIEGSAAPRTEYSFAPATPPPKATV